LFLGKWWLWFGIESVVGGGGMRKE